MQACGDGGGPTLAALIGLKGSRLWSSIANWPVGTGKAGRSGIAGLSLVLVLLNGALFLTNRTIQNEINTRQQLINQAVQLERLGQELVNALAGLALRNNDEQLRQLLADQGITLTPGSGPAGPAQAPR